QSLPIVKAEGTHVEDFHHTTASSAALSNYRTGIDSGVAVDADTAPRQHANRGIQGVHGVECACHSTNTIACCSGNRYAPACDLSRLCRGHVEVAIYGSRAAQADLSRVANS